MTGNSPACAVVIRAYNEAEHIGRLLDGLQQQTIKNKEIVLVDSGSTDGTLEIASRYPVKIVHIQPEDFTFGRSLNLGISHTSTDKVAFASAHVYPVYPDWLDKLLGPLDHPEVGLTYGKQRGTANSYYSEQQIFARWFPGGPQQAQDHPFCNNANAAIRRALWEKRPYDEKLSGLEDLEWANWVINQGYRLVYVPEAEIIHVHQETPRKVYNRYRREAMAFKRIFPQETFNFWDFLQLYFSNVVSDALQARQDRVLTAHWRSILWFRFMQFWGTFQGYRQSGPLTWQLRQTFYYPQGRREQDLAARRQIAPIQYNEKQD